MLSRFLHPESESKWVVVSVVVVTTSVRVVVVSVTISEGLGS